MLPLLIQSIVQSVVNERARYAVEVYTPLILNANVCTIGYINCVVEAATFAHGYDLLFLHHDADHSTTAKALRQYIRPACKRVADEKERGRKLCTDIVPVIPIRETEAWLLADQKALRSVLGISASTENLGLPDHIHEIESILDPKQRLQQIVQQFREGMDLKDLYEDLAAKIDLQNLQGLKAYREFIETLSATLQTLGMIACPIVS
ncbi:MAG TPA: DUF4276 family protein [Chthonomonadaceae bacterium]|nr:DUF4276 family protein [Chthonomonadaceae bacterium]